MKKYNFFTAFTMIIGICIGSGIFFKVDDILILTKGNVFYGILIFLLGALCCVFCGLTMGKMAQDFKNTDGINGFFEKCFNKKFAKGYDVFFAYLYLPSIAVVISWVAGIYTEMLFNLQPNFLQQLIIGNIYLMFFIMLNVVHFKLGEKIQTITTIIKLIPLFLIAFVGIFFYRETSISAPSVSVFSNLPVLLPIVFLFDGWSITTTIAGKIEKPTKAMHTALSFTPLFILMVYIFFFVGITNIVPTQDIITLGNETIYFVGKKIFGNIGASILLIIVLISILGALNGLSIGIIETSKIKLENKSSFKKILIIYFWVMMHYCVMNYKWIGNSDISEISVVFIYFVYAVLFIPYLKKLWIDKAYVYLVITSIAIVVNLILVFTSFYVSFFYSTLFFVICSVVWLLAYRKDKV